MLISVNAIRVSCCIGEPVSTERSPEGDFAITHTTWKGARMAIGENDGFGSYEQLAMGHCLNIINLI